MASLSGPARVAMLAQLQEDFLVACRYGCLSPESRAAAWAGVQRSPDRAAACYRAIAASLARPDGPARPKKQRAKA